MKVLTDTVPYPFEKTKDFKTSGLRVGMVYLMKPRVEESADA